MQCAPRLTVSSTCLPSWGGRNLWGCSRCRARPRLEDPSTPDFPGDDGATWGLEGEAPAQGIQEEDIEQGHFLRLRRREPDEVYFSRPLRMEAS